MRLVPIMAALCLVGCAKTPVATQQTNNPQVQVGVMFEVDGCKVYRFYDEGHARYFANCRGAVGTTWTESCGKNCVRTRTDSISTDGP